MSVTLSLAELLDYSDHERAKWRAWMAADPTRLGPDVSARRRASPRSAACSITCFSSSAGTWRG